MERKPVKSSNIASVGYDEMQEVLQVEFKGGKTYDYFDVPSVVHEEMMSSDSVGKYFHKNVRSKFSSQAA
jgi:hypothetical protein